VTALSKKSFHTFNCQPSIPTQEITTHARGANRSPLDIIGECQMTLHYNAKSSTQRVFVVHELQHNLLGLPAIHDLKIITGINAVELNVPDQYPTFLGVKREKGWASDFRFMVYSPLKVPSPLKSVADVVD